MIKFIRKPKSKSWHGEPFPSSAAVGYFTGGDVEVFDQIQCKVLADNGAFGLNPKPRQLLEFNQRVQTHQTISESEYQRLLEMRTRFDCDEIDEDAEMIQIENTDEFRPIPFKIPNSLVLFLEEAFFLCTFCECLEIRDLNDVKIEFEDLWRSFCGIKENFVECFVAYLFLRSRNWVIKPGMKFGGDYLLYKQSPSVFHASFVVIVQRSHCKVQKPIEEVHSNVRIAETTGKDLLYLEVIFPPTDITPETYLENLDKFEVKETIVKRHEFS